MNDVLHRIAAALRLLRGAKPGNLEEDIQRNVIAYLEAVEEPYGGFEFAFGISTEPGPRSWRTQRNYRTREQLLGAAGERACPGETPGHQAVAILEILNEICLTDEDGPSWQLNEEITIVPGSAADYLRQALDLPVRVPKSVAQLTRIISEDHEHN